MSHTSESLQAAFKYLFPDEVPFLKELAQSLSDNPVVVNIGAGAGTSGLALMESRPDLRLITIDIQYENSPFGCIFAEQKLMTENGHSKRYKNILGRSQQIGHEWKQGSVDMVFVDGGHKYDECSGDILAWLPNIKSGGIIAVHDYKKGELYASETDYQPDKPHPGPYVGVDQAVDELLLNRYELIKRVDSLIAFRII